MLAEQSSDPPPSPTTPPSAAPHTSDGAAPSEAPTLEQLAVAAVAPSLPPASTPPPDVPPPSQHQYISLDGAWYKRRFHEYINAVVQGHFPHPWPRLRMVPSEHQRFWFESMKITYWWDYDDESMFRVFHMWAGKYIRKTFSCARYSLVRPLWLVNKVWLQLQEFWADEDFQQESSKNKANRAANPTASSTVYRRGSSFVGMHKRKLEAELGRPPKQMELFERCYKEKEDGGWSGPRAAKVAVRDISEDDGGSSASADG
ncbi:UNVERIFIED_CONTAM: hypothetical protein Sradi_3203300 [Sesamum radiatum]|uniref:Uncharacterized protein n=1 Tax=Sesamum radiatum TaxID=300843 RepID=A0AAW2RHP2_SESRA